MEPVVAGRGPGRTPYGPAMKTVVALLALAVALVVVAALLPAGLFDYPLLLLGAVVAVLVALVLAVVRGVRNLRARRGRTRSVRA